MKPIPESASRALRSFASWREIIFLFRAKTQSCRTVRNDTGNRLDEIEALETQCFNEVNRLRVAQSLNPLAFNEGLLRLARDYSRRMAEEQFFSHSDPSATRRAHRLARAR